MKLPLVLWPLMMSIFLLAGCDGSDADPLAGFPLGQDHVQGTPQPVPPDANSPLPPADPSRPSSAKLGESCAGSGNLCLSIRTVIYKDEQGKPVVSETDTLENLAQINRIWAQCSIAFEIGEYHPVDPRDFGLNFNTSTTAELTGIRQTFGDPAMLVVVTTGAWAGTLGAGAANAWTMMPGGGDYGVVLESIVGTYPNIIAHELGHYLNLGHVSDTTDVMNAIIYQGSTSLTATQCSQARAAAAYYWKSMYR
ncbi:MAG: hypothetical protein A2X94_00685 [Bdellovibrionales bacterium GWB1_55_8]|nr:MAG: hypothetical protein A2X94_00685 [Bdellovibrionales bacterium GWB1_55_8]